MSADVTPAMKRARHAMGITGFDQREAYLVMDAALDIEEMARALYMRPTRNPDFPTWEDQSERIREYWREYARIIRTALLGADS